MNKQKLMKVTYYDEKNSIRLTGYADTVVWDEKGKATLAALRFGGYPEEVRGLADAIYGGITIEIESEDGAMTLSTLAKQYRRVLSYDGVYAEATLIAEDDGQTAKNGEKKTEDDANAALAEPQTELDLPPRNTYIFCTPGDKADLFRAVDQKTAVPLIPEFQDYVLSELTRRKILRPLRVKSISRKMEAWLLRCEEKDKNIVAVLESGLKSGAIAIPGAVPGPSPLDKLESVTDYLNTFGVTVAERIKNLFVPLFDPSKEPLSPEVLAVNQYIHDHAGYSLYDAQLAVAESVKRQLQRNKVGLIVAECGAGKTKIGAAAIASTAAGLYAQHKNAGLFKTFNVVLCPSHVTKKWVREVEETVPNTFAAVVHSIQEFDHLYQMYERGTKSCFAILSKEKARDGYMRAPAVLYRQWNREGLQIDRKTPLPDCGAANERPDTPVFCCPECGTAVMANISRDGTVYRIPANSLFFRREHRENHKCEACGASLWTALNPSAWGRQKAWAKIGDYGFVYRPLIDEHIRKAKSEALKEKLGDLSMTPGAVSAARGANRAFPLSSYIKRKYKGRIYGLIVDELHQYNNKSGQGDAMAELYDTAKKVVGMTATLINGYSSGIFYLLYRMVPSLMKKDGKDFTMDQTLNAKMRARMEEVRAQVAERDDLIEVIAIALLTRKNVFILGDTGQAKSYAVNLFREGITGARQFERLMSKQTDEEALFGRLDLSSLIPGGVPDEVLSRDSRYQDMQRQLDACLADRRDTRALVEEMEQYRKALSALHSGAPRTIIRGKIPDSHICFLDEIFKASDGILNALLTALNERRYTNEGTTIDIPTISFFSASNEIPNFSNPEEKILKPLYDRFELKVVTEYVEDRAARLSVLKGKQARQGQLKPLPAALVTLDELEEMQQDVAGVAVPDSVNELMDDVLCELRGKGVHISDRKYFSYAPIAQAKAWLEGRDTVESSDLTILRHYLWTAPEERTVIQGTLERMCNDPLKDRLDGILASALESYEDFNQSVDAPAARRIGKLRDEYLRLYEQIAQMDAAAQNDGERQKIQDCKNMISVIAAFSQACELAALEDDGLRSKIEERELRKIRAAAERFRGELARVMK